MSYQIEHHDNGMTINIEGESYIFGGVDLRLRAIFRLIQSLDFKFANEEYADYDEKAKVLIINEMGRLIQNEGHFNAESNLHAAQAFLSWFIKTGLHETSDYKVLLQDKNEAFEY